MSKWKVVLTLPRFIRTFRKAKKMAKKIKHDPNIVSEEYRYRWLQKRAKYLLWILGVKVHVHNIKYWPDKGCVIVTNHQSNIDPLLLLKVNNFAKFAPVGFIAKKELQDDKHFKHFLKLIDVLFMDRDNPRDAFKVFEQARELIRVPRAMVIFPEGTRSHNQELLEFKAAAFKLPQKAYVPIVPVSIVDSYKVLDPANKKIKTHHVHLVFHKPLPADSIFNANTDILANKVKCIIQKGVDEYQNFDVEAFEQQEKAKAKQLKKKKKKEPFKIV